MPDGDGSEPEQIWSQSCRHVGLRHNLGSASSNLQRQIRATRVRLGSDPDEGQEPPPGCVEWRCCHAAADDEDVPHQAPAATTVARVRAQAPHETAAATTAAQVRVVDCFHGEW